ncbi:MAG: DUF4097 family beta strand repeat-containing protein [Woeseia sp.]
MLQTLLMMIMFAANLVQAAWKDYEETRDLSLDAVGVETLQIEAGAGSLDVTGVPGADRIVVAALIRVPDADADEAREAIADGLVLSLDRDGDRADLRGFFDDNGSLFGSNLTVSLEVRLPDGISLSIQDGSGSVELRDVRGDIELDDRSGSIRMTNVGGNLNVTDGSGSIAIEGAGGEVSIVDGSGSVSVVRVEGSVTIEDGSGSIDVNEVAGDLIIPDDGSGAVNYTSIAGRVDQAD